MRLAVEVTTCTSSRTGIGYYTEHIVDALIATAAPGDELALLGNRPPAPELAARWAPYLRVAGGPVRAVWMQAQLPGLLRDAGADVGLFPNYVAPLASPCTLMVMVHDLALLRTPEHFTRRKRLVMTPLLRQSVAAAARVVTVSEASRRDIIAELGVEPGRTAVVPGAPHPSCGPAPVAAIDAVRARHGLRRPYVLTVGTLEPRKNLLGLLQAWDALARPDLDLVVVGGRGWRDRALVRALEARRAGGQVRWLGYVPEVELAPLYSGAALFVYPSRLEGFGLPVLEAMACGAPVVASDVPALREVAGDAAAFAPPGDPAALAAAMAGVLGDPRAARERGPRRAAAFSWRRSAEAVWQLARDAGPARVRGARGVPGRPLGDAPAELGPREWALLATVAYADLFDAPLPLAEAATAGIGAALDEAEARRLASGPALASRVTLHPGGWLTLAGRDELVARRLAGAVTTAALLERHRRMLGLLAALPFVRLLAFSGGTVHQNPGAHPDIDLFVVAARGRAYTAYSLIWLATKLGGARAIVCPNYLVDEDELRIAYHHDLFTAHQLVSARPLAGEATYVEWCRANEAWVRRFYPAFAPRAGLAEVASPALQRLLERALAPAAPLVEGALRRLWRVHLRRRAAAARRADVVLADGILKLHLSDYRRRVLARFAARLDGLRSGGGGEPCASPS